jgi:hypothetical protein
VTNGKDLILNAEYLIKKANSKGASHFQHQLFFPYQASLE